MSDLTDEISRCIISTLVETFRHPEFEIDQCLKFVEYEEDETEFRLRLEMFANEVDQQVLGAWSISLTRENNYSHLEDHDEQN